MGGRAWRPRPGKGRKLGLPLPCVAGGCSVAAEWLAEPACLPLHFSLTCPSALSQPPAWCRSYLSALRSGGRCPLHS